MDLKENIPVLDKGFVRLLSVYGNDLSIVEAARVSTSKSSKGEAADKKLIAFLMEQEHGSVFEFVIYKFQIKCPIFVMRQIVRHRVSSLCEKSARYTELTDEFYEPDVFRAQSKTNRQGSEISDDLDHDRLALIVHSAHKDAYEAYQTLLKQGVAREMARMVLPVSIYTEFFWSINARSLMNFLKLRLDEHSQYEIRAYATTILSIFEQTCPWVASAFKEFQLKQN